MARNELESSRDFWRVIAGYFVPPLGVFLQSGFGGAFLINVVLTFLFYVPAQVHAMWVIASVGEGGRAQPNAGRTFLSLLLAAVLPPVGVALRSGIGLQLLINLVLTAFFWIPGVIHAIWAITHADE